MYETIELPACGTSISISRAMMATYLRRGRLFLVSCLAFLAFHSFALGAEALSAGHSSATSNQRHLLQVESPCPIVFSDVDYSPVTSVCKFNVTAQDICCNAFAAFNCRYATYLNQLNTTCNQDFFTYLGQAGSYPPGFWANTCQYLGDRNNGLPCPISPAPAPAPESRYTGIPYPISPAPATAPESNEGRLLKLGLAAPIATVGIHLLLELL